MVIAVTAATTCTHQWQVRATLEPVLDSEESVMETVVRSTATKDNKTFADAARMRLQWTLTRKVGANGFFVQDERATAQASGLGILPDVLVDPIFEDTSCGPNDWCGSFSPQIASTSSEGWFDVITINDALGYGPVVITTSTPWRNQQGRMDICSNKVVLRMPLLELLDITDEEPYVELGELRERADLDHAAWAAAVLALPPHLARASDWNTLRVLSVPGFSWITAVLAYNSSANGAHLSLQVSSNSFQQIGSRNFPALDLMSIYPFQTSRSVVQYDWNLQHQGGDAYDGDEEIDTYLNALVDDDFPWETGPCATSLGYWRPELWSLGSILVAPTTWGLAFRRADNMGLHEEEIMEDWVPLAPLCGRVLPSAQLDPVDKNAACAFLFIPGLRNTTVELEDETYDHRQFSNLTMPTIFAAAGTEGTCEPGAEQVGFRLTELKDASGANLHDFLESQNEDFMVNLELVDAAAMQPNGLGPIVVLVRFESAHETSFRTVSYENSTWVLGLELPQKTIPIPFRSFSRGERLFPNIERERIAQGENGTQLDIRGVDTLPRMSQLLYTWGNALFVSQNAGHTFWKVAQTSSSVMMDLMDVDASELETLLFADDPITRFTAAQDGWIAVLTENARIWLGKAGADIIFPLTLNLTSSLDLLPPYDLFFDEAGALRVTGLEVTGVEAGKRQARPAETLNTDRVKDLALYFDENDSACLLDDALIVAKHDVEHTRTVYKSAGLTTSMARDVQAHGFRNTLPTRIFLNRGGNYTFRIRLFSAVEHNEIPHQQVATLAGLHVGFELSTQELISLSFQRQENLIEGTVDYDVMLEDRGRWDLTSSVLKAPYDAEMLAATHAQPGSQLLVTSVGIRGLSQGCTSEVDPAALVTRTSASPAIRLDVYSGCPPHQRLEFDREASLDGVNQGCEETDEDICVFYDNTFTPRFRLIDSSIDASTILDASFGELIAIGGGLTYDTIVDYPEDDRAALTLASFSVSSTSTVRWLCMAASSPCAAVAPEFPKPPQYFFKLRLVATSNDSYCDFSTDFVVRIHNLPITLQAIMVTNGITIMVCMIPLLYFYNRRQKRNQHKRLRGLRGVGMMDLANGALDLDKNSDSDRSSDSSDDDAESPRRDRSKTRRGSRSRGDDEDEDEDDEDDEDEDEDDDEVDDDDDEDDEDDDDGMDGNRASGRARQQ
ncbi:Cation channel sperm-associated protein subunit gamma [Hondaea fermentalgiana]|uniref:Cation channel sperm-associated protein subunit gamma n=1 Tax=Hondaea fermentalgiana TaxID=2315210 RepID=A0A2R5GXR1_9STRA|nr:Cation channel sperm-associated protein subunit gamma [Hondaea fermentalgiana]|eukprot:GBG33211.1 Cation channel sperm-associated protein subunit gamma [Hondaea fermentalgiana]